VNVLNSRSRPWPAYAGGMILAFLLLPAIAWGQTTYTWNKTASASWATGGNWLPQPQFSGDDRHPGDRRRRHTHADADEHSDPDDRPVAHHQQREAIFMSATNGNTLTISGATSPAFEMQTGTTLTVNDNKGLTISMTGTATSSISGAISLGATAHRLLAVNAGQVTFQSGGSLTTLASFSATCSEIPAPRMRSCSRAVRATSTTRRRPVRSPRPPITRDVPARKHGVFRTATGYQSSGRTYANLTAQNNALLTGTGTGNLQFHNLTVESGSSFTNTERHRHVTVTGDVSIAGSATSR